MDASTVVAGVIGSPVRHSLSPALHNAAFAAHGLNWAYVAFEVPPGRGAAALAAMRTLGLGGLSVTMPLKEEAFEAVDRLDPAAGALRSVNTVAVDADGALVGYSTDGEGFVASLGADAGFDPSGARVVVVGAGGAGRAVVDALARHGAAEIVVVNRNQHRAVAAAALAAGIGRVGSNDDVPHADLVVNATSLGMSGDTTLPVPGASLRPGQLVADLVYHPLDTPLLVAARSVGARTLDGLGMLVHQAALQQELWTGSRPDVHVMRRAAEAELARR